MNALEVPEIKVYLNIYDLNTANTYLRCLGLGIYHTGIQFFDSEFTFGHHDGTQTGVFESEPRQACHGRFRESICFGTTHLSIEEVLDAIEELKADYIGCSYNVYTKNCNHFSEDLCRKLTNKNVPKYLNRLAKISAPFRCILPKSFGNKADTVQHRANHRKKDSIHLNSNRIMKKKTLPGETQNQSQAEKLSLTNHDEKNESSSIA